MAKSYSSLHQRNERIIWTPHIINAIHFSSANELRPIETLFFPSTTFVRLNANHSPINWVFLFVLHLRKYYSEQISIVYFVCWRNKHKKSETLTLSKFDVGNDWFHWRDCCEMCCMDIERKMMKMPSSTMMKMPRTHCPISLGCFFLLRFFADIHSPQNVPAHRTHRNENFAISYSLTFRIVWGCLAFSSIQIHPKCQLVSQTTMTHSSYHSILVWFSAHEWRTQWNFFSLSFVIYFSFDAGVFDIASIRSVILNLMKIHSIGDVCLGCYSKKSNVSMLCVLSLALAIPISLVSSVYACINCTAFFANTRRMMLAKSFAQSLYVPQYFRNYSHQNWIVLQICVANFIPSTFSLPDHLQRNKSSDPQNKQTHTKPCSPSRETTEKSNSNSNSKLEAPISKHAPKFAFDPEKNCFSSSTENCCHHFLCAAAVLVAPFVSCLVFVMCLKMVFRWFAVGFSYFPFRSFLTAHSLLYFQRWFLVVSCCSVARFSFSFFFSKHTPKVLR